MPDCKECEFAGKNVAGKHRYLSVAEKRTLRTYGVSPEIADRIRVDKTVADIWVGYERLIVWHLSGKTRKENAQLLFKILQRRVLRHIATVSEVKCWLRMFELVSEHRGTYNAQHFSWVAKIATLHETEGNIWSFHPNPGLDLPLGF